MRIEFEVPDQLGLLLAPQDLTAAFKLNNAMILFQEGKVSIGLAAELAGTGIYDFMMACGRHDIPVVNYSPEELQAEIEAIRQKQI
ncbi:MAG: UPF0175 family protein [Candidatus Sericytochromatia bacterium]